MKFKIPKCPPLAGSPAAQVEQMRDYYNRAIDELVRAIEDLEKRLDKAERSEKK